MFVLIEICEVEERMTAMVMEKTANSANAMSLITELQKQVHLSHRSLMTRVVFTNIFSCSVCQSVLFELCVLSSSVSFMMNVTFQF